MNVSGSLVCLKQVASVEVSSNFIKELCSKVFNDAKVCESFNAGANLVVNVSGQIFSYFNPATMGAVKAWSSVLNTGIDDAAEEASSLIALIPADNEKGSDLKICLKSFITECQEIKNILKAQKDEVQAANTVNENTKTVSKKK